MKNRLILFIWSILAWVRVPRKKTLSNGEANREALRTGSFWTPGEYIENQAQWREVRFGSKYSMSYGGCGIFAVYNLFVALGQPAAVEDFESLMAYFQRRGAAVCGKFGLSPRAITHFLKKRGFEVRATSSLRASVVNAMSGLGDAFLVTACNGSSLTDWIHTVCITGDGQGGYTVHNGYHLVELPDGKRKYCENGPFPTLSEAVRNISADGAIPVVVLAIRAGR